MEPRPAELTVWEHLDALRAHVLWGAGFFLLATIACFSVVDPLIHLLLMPLRGQQLVFLSVLGPLFFKLQVAFLLAVAVSVPVWIALVLHFAAPALSRQRRLAALVFVVGAAVLAALSLVVSYFYLVPATLKILLGMAIEGTTFVLTADSYLDFFFLEAIVAFVIFELPLIINLLVYVGLLNPHRLKGKRRILYVVLLIVLAVLTPTTDVFSLLAVFAPAVLFAEGGLLIARVFHTRRHSAEPVR